MSRIVPKKLKGLFCRGCLWPHLRVVSIYRPLAGVRIRYCRCAKCGQRAKTREVLIEPSPKRKLATGS